MQPIEKYGEAQWRGGIKDGGGEISTESGVLKKTPYGFNARFEGGPGSNPEELVGAAHAACFAMALSKALGDAGYKATRLDARSTIRLEKDGDGFTITRVQIDLDAVVPDIDDAKFQSLAEATKKGCPVSKLLNAELGLTAKLAKD